MSKFNNLFNQNSSSRQLYCVNKMSMGGGVAK